jgi:phosphodiesterase/alkaline phosphatase D-like protein
LLMSWRFAVLVAGIGAGCLFSACAGGGSDPAITRLPSPSASEQASAEDLPPSQLFTAGVASGDLTASSAILWTRTDGPADVLAQLYEGDDPGESTQEQSFTTVAEHDFTLHWRVEGLEPDTRYSYRFVVDGAASPAGSFTTAPAAESETSFRFVISVIPMGGATPLVILPGTSSRF